MCFEERLADCDSALRRAVRVIPRPHAVSDDDLIQIAYLRAWRNRASFDQEREMLPWLITIARRAGIDEMRRGTARNEVAVEDRDLIDAVSPDPSPDVLFGVSERVACLVDAFGNVKDRHRRVLIASAVDGKSYREIATAEGISVTAVKPLVRRARQSVRHAYMVRAGARGLLVPIGSLVIAARAVLRRLRSGLSGASAAGLALAPLMIFAAFLLPHSSGLPPEPPPIAVASPEDAARTDRLESQERQTSDAPSPEEGASSTPLVPGSREFPGPMIPSPPDDVVVELSPDIGGEDGSVHQADSLDLDGDGQPESDGTSDTTYECGGEIPSASCTVLSIVDSL